MPCFRRPAAHHRRSRMRCSRCPSHHRKSHKCCRCTATWTAASQTKLRISNSHCLLVGWHDCAVAGLQHCIHSQGLCPCTEAQARTHQGPRMAHCHNCSYKERFIADFGRKDDAHRLQEALHERAAHLGCDFRRGAMSRSRLLRQRVLKWNLCLYRTNWSRRGANWNTERREHRELEDRAAI